MKKISILSLLTLSLGVFIFSSCCNKAKMPKAELKTESDSLAYGIGISDAHGLRQQLIGGGIDSVYLDAFVQGFLNSAFATDSQKIAYNIGVQIGLNINERSFNQYYNQRFFGDDSAKYLNKDVFLAGFVAGILEKNIKMEKTAAADYVDQVMAKIRAEQEKKQIEETEKLYAPNKEAGIKFLNENKDKAGVITLESGVQYKIIKKGNGPKPTTTDRVKVNYKGTLVDGTEFDNSYDNKEKPVFGVTQVIPGWTEILQLMPVGSKWEVYIPQELAYGVQDRGTIKPFSALIFEMELLEIVK